MSALALTDEEIDIILSVIIYGVPVERVADQHGITVEEFWNIVDKEMQIQRQWFEGFKSRTPIKQ